MASGFAGALDADRFSAAARDLVYDACHGFVVDSVADVSWGLGEEADRAVEKLGASLPDVPHGLTPHEYRDMAPELFAGVLGPVLEAAQTISRANMDCDRLFVAFPRLTAYAKRGVPQGLEVLDRLCEEWDRARITYGCPAGPDPYAGCDEDDEDEDGDGWEDLV